MDLIIPPASRLAEVGEYYFSKKLEEVRQLRLKGADVINLGIGSPDLAPSEATIEAAIQAIKKTTNHGYATSRSTPELRESFAKWYKTTFSIALKPDENILPLLGSKEGIMYISLAFLNLGDGVLIPNPGYPPYANAAKIIGAKPIYYDLKEENNWYPDFEKIENMGLKNVKLMWANYPHMPTGAPATGELFEKFVKFAKKNKILICHDNPYTLVLNPEPLSILQFDKGMECTLELNSLSKAFNMAGWRVGMALGSKSAISSILQMKSNVDSGMFLGIQAAAQAAMGNSAQWHNERNETYGQRRDIVYKIFDHLKFKYNPGHVGLFVWAKAPDSIKDLGGYLDEILNKAHVFMVPGIVFGSNGARFARSSICADVKVLEEALKRIQSL